MKYFFEGFFVGFTIILLLFSNPAFAFSVENNPVENVFVENSFDKKIFLEEVSPQEYYCNITSLSPLESKKIMDLTKENFQGEEISDGSSEKATGVDLKDLELIGQDNDGVTAVKQTVPSKAASAERFDFLSGRLISGPFGIGVVLEDTLRVGRCVDLEQENCRVYGNGLAFRTSGKGVSNMFVDTSTS